MFRDSFSFHAERPCVRSKEGAWTYRAVMAMGRDLLSQLPPPPALIVLRCSLSVQAIAAYVALVDAGYVPLLVEDDLAPELLERFVSIYRPAAVLDPLRATTTVGANAPTLAPALGVLLTTSGSTGSPKLVRMSLAALRANSSAIADFLAIGPDERPYLHLPISYSYGLSIINSHLLRGAEICLASYGVLESGYWDEVRTYEATSIAGVPFHYTAIRRVGEARLDIPSLRTLTQAGGRLDPKLVSHFAGWAERTGRRFFVMYGQTEAGPRIAYLPPERATEAPDAIGIPIPGVRIELVDENGLEVSEGEVGELVCFSPGVMMGYAERAEDLVLGDELCGRLSTGDLARRSGDGLIRIVGRRSRILKIYGLRLNIDEVEQQLRSQGRHVHCFGEDDKLRVLVRGGAPAEVREEILRIFSVPPRGVEVRAADTIAVAASGKISADALAAAWKEAAA